MNTAMDHLIDRLEPYCEFIYLHAEGDGETVVDLLHDRVGMTFKFFDHPKPMTISGPNIEACLSKAWKRRP